MAVKSPINTVGVQQRQSGQRLYWMILLAVILTLWVLLKEDAQDDDTIELAQSASNSQPSAQKRTETNQQHNPSSRANAQHAVNKRGAIAWQKLQRTSLPNQPQNVFKVHAWLVTPPPDKTARLPPPPPEAPPAPFTYVGKLENTPQGTQVFLMRNTHLFTVTKSQHIDAQWRLDAEELNSIRLTYLPLNLPQVLSKMAKSFEPIGNQPQQN